MLTLFLALCTGFYYVGWGASLLLISMCGLVVIGVIYCHELGQSSSYMSWLE